MGPTEKGSPRSPRSKPGSGFFGKQFHIKKFILGFFSAYEARPAIIYGWIFGL